MYRYISALVVLIICVPIIAHAETILRIGDKISVESEQVVDGDYYVSVGPFGTTVMSGNVTGDMYALGGTVTANGQIDGDFGALAGIANINASVADDVRIVSGETVIDDVIGGDVFVISGVIKVLSTASIEGDLVFYGGDAEINGTIGGSIYGAAQHMRIDAVVEGDIDVSATNGLTIGGRSDIAGDVRYESLVNLNRAQDAIIAGSITKTEIYTASTQEVVKGLLMPLFVSLFATLSLYLLFKSQMQRIIETVHRSSLKSGLFGLSALVLAPFLSILLLATVLGILLGLLGVGLTIALYALGFTLSNALVGSYLAKVFTKKPTVSLSWIVFGACVFQIMILMPIIGPILALTVLSLTIGGCVLSVYHRLI